MGWLRAAALLALGVFSVVALGKDKQPTAIVVGGGLAGLSTAYELQQSGWQVTLLEAKPQIGGRSGLATSEWIGNTRTQPTLNGYLDAFKLKAVPAPDFVRTPSYLIDGVYYSSSDLEKKMPAVAADLKRAEKALDDLSASIDDPLNPLANKTLFALDQINAARWLDKQNLSPTARMLVNQRIRTRYDEPSRLSLLYLAQQGRVYRNVDDRDLRAARLPGGSQVLAQAFVKQLKTIKTNARVTSITQDKDGVTVKVGATGYSADYVVLAVPLRALGQIQMIPSLAEAQQAALKSTNYGWRDQILMKFKRPVWDDKSRLSGEIYSDQGLGMIWVEPALKGAANVLVNLSGDNARVLQAFGDRQIVDQVLIRMNKYYPKMRGAFDGYELRRYSTDVGTGGSYLAYGPGQISRFWRVWEKPVSRVVFAGEHTDALYPGTLEGALRSGKRAASQVRDLSAGKTPELEGNSVAASESKPAATSGDSGEKKSWFRKLF
ncbi:Pseudooxynicotine oxidase [compost metagenome]